jgi:hypothetical protein
VTEQHRDGVGGVIGDEVGGLPRELVQLQPRAEYVPL